MNSKFGVPQSHLHRLIIIRKDEFEWNSDLSKCENFWTILTKLHAVDRRKYNSRYYRSIRMKNREREKNWTGINIEKGWKFSIIKIEKIENKYCFFYIFKYSFLLFLIMKNKIYICIYVYMHNLNSKGKIIPFVIIKLNQ